MPPYNGSSNAIPLPSPAYRCLKNVAEDGACRVGSMVHVVGLVTDYRLPIPTKGDDYKAQVTLVDHTNHEDYDAGVLLNIFRPMDQMPDDTHAGDVILVTTAKVQQFGGGRKSLITNRTTEIFVFDKQKIPTYPGSAEVALRPAPGGRRKQRRALNEKEYKYVSWLHQATNKDYIPDDSTFENKKQISLNVKDKFCLLKNVQVDTFRDIVVRLVKDPHDLGDRMTLWVSDYTENERFFRFDSQDGDLLYRDGDEFGYTSHMARAPVQHNRWTGPHGQFSMQLTCYEPHLSQIREDKIRLGDWVTFKNVHIKYGRNGNNVEGFLREDRQSQNKIQVIQHFPMEDDPLELRVKDAIRRKVEYESSHKRTIKSLAAANAPTVAAGNQKKRPAGENDNPPRKLNSKEKRSKRRAAELAAKEKEEEEMAKEELNLNPLVRCEHMTQPITPIPKMLEPVIYKTTIDGNETEIPLPFTNTKYRTVGRVVDFRPNNIAKFATGRKMREEDCLSDYDPRDDVSSSGDDDCGEGAQGTLSQYQGRRTWEWRFALQLEDTYPSKKKEYKHQQEKRQRFWIVVDNFAGQCLLNMDAADFTKDPDALERLKGRLFLLWGDLEEQKREVEKKKSNKKSKNKKDSTCPDLGAKASNKPFSCCVKEHGIEVKAGKGEEATSADGKKRWERVFSLFGVKILSS